MEGFWFLSKLCRQEGLPVSIERECVVTQTGMRWLFCSPVQLGFKRLGRGTVRRKSSYGVRESVWVNAASISVTQWPNRDKEGADSNLNGQIPHAAPTVNKAIHHNIWHNNTIREMRSHKVILLLRRLCSGETACWAELTTDSPVEKKQKCCFVTFDMKYWWCLHVQYS